MRYRIRVHGRNVLAGESLQSQMIRNVDGESDAMLTAERMAITAGQYVAMITPLEGPHRHRTKEWKFKLDAIPSRKIPVKG